MSIALKGKTAWNKGKITPDEVRLKQSMARFGKKMDESVRLAMIGRKISEETKQKMSYSAKLQQARNKAGAVEDKAIWHFQA